MGVELSTYGLDSIFCCGLKTLASLISLFLSCIFLLSVPPTQSTDSSKLTTKKQQKSLQALLLFLIKCLETVLYASAFISSSLTSCNPSFALDCCCVSGTAKTLTFPFSVLGEAAEPCYLDLNHYYQFPRRTNLQLPACSMLCYGAIWQLAACL